VITRFFITLGAAIAAILLVVLALANRHTIDIGLDPFNPANPVLQLTLPLFVVLFSMLILGVIVGGMSVWIDQGKWRRTARQRTQEAIRWKGEVERLTRERDSHVAAAKQLAAATPSQKPQRPLGATPSLAIAGR